MQHMYQDILKKGNGAHKYLRCPDLWDNNFEVLRSEIALDKVDLGCTETGNSKPTRNDSGFITYQKHYFSGIWLDNSGYLIPQCQKFMK